MTNLSAQPWFNEPSLRKVFALLNANGGEARIVGGAVRNSLMGHAVGDIDIATTLVPAEVIARAEDAKLKAIPTGIDHGTVTLVADGKPFEVTTLRRDVATDGRHAEVAFGADWEEDANRRDLTMNALYAGEDGEVVDLVGGLADIEAGIVRFIGDADARIAEDYLRVLRFFRFFAWYGSGRPDAAGLKACARGRDHLGHLSAERVWSETKKLLGATDPGRALLWMRQSGVLTAVLPETEKWGIDSIGPLVASEQALGWAPDALLRLASMVPRDRERLAAMAKRLRLSNAEAAYLDSFAKAPDIADDMKEAGLDRLLYREGRDGIVARLKLAFSAARGGTDSEEMEKVARYSRLLKRAEGFARPVFPLNGSDLLAAGFAAGPKVGTVLKALENEWVDKNFSVDRAKLLARLDDYREG